MTLSFLSLQMNNAKSEKTRKETKHVSKYNDIEFF